MKSILAIISLAVTASAFTSPAFTARTTNVCSRADLACAPQSVSRRSGALLKRFAEEKKDVVEGKKDEEEMSETQKLMQQVKDSGTAGVISYALWELAFWFISVPVCVVGYQQVTGHWPDISNADDQKQLGAEAFAFVNFARFAVPLRIGLALSTTGWIQKNIVDNFMSGDASKDSKEEETLTTSAEQVAKEEVKEEEKVLS